MTAFGLAVELGEVQEIIPEISPGLSTELSDYGADGDHYGRRTWTEEGKLQVLEEAAQPRVRLSDVSHRHDILPQQIRRWRRQLFGEVPTIPEAPIFAPVTLIEAAPPAQPDGRSSKPRPMMVEISLRNGRVLKVAADLEPLFGSGARPQSRIIIGELEITISEKNVRHHEVSLS